MSYHTLQKLTVRLLFDPIFVAALYNHPDETLAGLDLTEQERAQLLAVDRRAWGYDALRCRRTLRTLAEEYKISTTIVLSETRSLASLEHFFATPFFHRAIQDRGSLALSFADYLQDGFLQEQWNAPQLPDLIRLEASIAACRRRLECEGGDEPAILPTTISDRARIRLASGYDVASFQANVIATVQHVEQYLFELSLMPAMALCDDAPRLSGLPAVEAQPKTYLLFSPGANGISLTQLDRTTFLLLHDARRAVEIRALLARPSSAKTHGQRTQEILSEWLEAGALRIVG